MYRVVVKSVGKYNNAALGARYCFTKRSVIKLATYFMSMKCECKIEKFVRLYDDVFCWSDIDFNSNIWTKIYNALEELTIEEN